MNFNRTYLAGNIASDPELKYVVVAGEKDRVPVVELTLAVDRKGSRGDAKPDFFPIVAWRGHALAIANHKKKGDPIFVEGRLEYRQWENGESGEKRSRVVVRAALVRFLASPRGRAAPLGARRGHRASRREAPRRAPNAAAT